MGNHEELAEKLRTILLDGFGPADVTLSVRESVVAFVISERFEGMDDMDRQEAIWSILEKSLDRQEQRSVAIVVALTPKERAFHEAGSV